MKEENKNNSMSSIFIENLSPNDFESTLNILLEEVEKKSWKISKIYDLQNTMSEHGKNVLPVKVISICHPKHSGRILERDSERIISSMMPCRISIYEKKNGKTYISRMNSLNIASSFSGIIKQVITDSASEVEDIIAVTLHK